MLHGFTTLTLCAATLAASGCAGDFDDGAYVEGEQIEDVGQVQERLFNKDANPTSADQTVRIQRLATRCYLVSTCDNTTDTFGPGIEALRNGISGADKEDIFVAFPNGHPTNPATIIFLSAGMQDPLQKDYLDSMTGQEDLWRPSGRTTTGADRKFLGDSLFGRLQADPRVASWGSGESRPYIVLVLDNGAGWGDPDSREIHESFAKFVKAKITTGTKRVILGGYSRGGILTAEMGRHLRMTSGIAMRDDIALYVGLMDPVSGGGGKFGVNSSSTQANPLVNNSDGYDFMQEISPVENQISAAKRRNMTFYYNDVSGGRVVSQVTTVHAFGSKTYDIIPSYWTERWEAIPHTEYKNVDRRAQMLDPFMDWLTEMDLRAKAGMYTTNHNDAWVSAGAPRTIHLDAKQGSNFTFQTMWTGAYTADLDIQVADSAGTVVAGGYTGAVGIEQVSFTVPKTDTYTVTVYAYSGQARTKLMHTVSYDPTQIGYVYLPNEQINERNNYSRSYLLGATTDKKAINLELSWDDQSVDVDMVLKNKLGQIVASSGLGNDLPSNTNSNAERISYKVVGTEAPYTVVVESFSKKAVKFEMRGTAPLLP